MRMRLPLMLLLAAIGGCEFIPKEVVLNSSQQQRLNALESEALSPLSNVARECLKKSELKVAAMEGYMGKSDRMSGTRWVAEHAFSSYPRHIVVSSLQHEAGHILGEHCGLVDRSKFSKAYSSMDGREYSSKRYIEMRVEDNYPWWKRSDERVVSVFQWWLEGSRISPEMEAVFEHLVHTRPKTTE